ncbi:galactose mutarotase [Antarcticibacterium flavum]|uniref:Aldose 1-epimerase n=2 Tax=Flavobacteriaceae TaxID=49546 RepID=A0A5B7X7H3_9FLAO|nr:galactose mutarotase [Antarcticibacterium sp. W02-3]QCY71359.1 galactose mutarotase [Antarcticibacterium flavum]
MQNVQQVQKKDLKIYELENSNGMILRILNLGAAVFQLLVKDHKGKLIDVAVGPKEPETFITTTYEEENRCFGASVGRYAGRISNGTFQLEGKEYQLSEKDGVHLHGGDRGFQHKLWNLEEQSHKSLSFSYTSVDGEEGYPGELKVMVIYTLTDDNEVVINYTAKSDKATPVNLTNHTYFNLNGRDDITDHELFLSAEKILQVDDKLRPTGEYVSLGAHKKNFHPSKPIGMTEVDYVYVLKKQNSVAVRLFAPQTQIGLEITTNQPAVVVYIPKNLPQLWEYKTKPVDFPSVCLEAQNFPDAPNHQAFPNSILEPGKKYLNRTVFKFTLGENDL